MLVVDDISIHVPRMGARRRTKAVYCNNGTFQSTYPVQGTPPPISGRRLKTSSFNPRAPCGAGRKWGGIPTGITQFQSTHPVGARHVLAIRPNVPTNISTHMPRRARRRMARRSTSLSMDFNPPAPCGAGQTPPKWVRGQDSFQSTCPVWGRTYAAPEREPIPFRISIHLPRVGQDVTRHNCAAGSAISIHLPRVGQDLGPWPCPDPVDVFQSTCPVWGRTRRRHDRPALDDDFNPPAPCGAGRCCGWKPPNHRCNFNPPAPCGAGHSIPRRQADRHAISIHLPRVGQDTAAELI